MPLEKDKIGLILLGASSFPKAPSFQGSEAFTQAKDRIRGFFGKNFFTDENTDKILDLFDTPEEPDYIDEQINDFIEKNRTDIKDLVIYYVGHGGYDSDNGFLLTIKKSRQANLGVSSITAKSLGRTLSKSANKLRLFLILDCCFAGEIFNQFQSPVMDVVHRSISESFPENGLALLCATSKDKPAIIVKDRNITMFSEGLDSAFRKGNPNIKSEYLSFRQIAELTYSLIKQNNPGEAVRPEVHSPKMSNGDIADLPHFINNSYTAQGVAIAYDIDARKKEIEDNIMNNNLQNASKLFMDFVNDFDRKKNYIITVCLTVAKCNELEEGKPAKGTPDYEQYKKERLELYSEILKIVHDIRTY
jgi:hypothetical protein